MDVEAKGARSTRRPRPIPLAVTTATPVLVTILFPLPPPPRGPRSHLADLDSHVRHHPTINLNLTHLSTRAPRLTVGRILIDRSILSCHTIAVLLNRVNMTLGVIMTVPTLAQCAHHARALAQD
jgi:hypothetical protein